MPIIPDTKNWTWVLEKPCSECGYDAADYPDAVLASAMRTNAEPWRGILSRSDVRDRPDDSTWSPSSTVPMFVTSTGSSSRA